MPNDETQGVDEAEADVFDDVADDAADTNTDDDAGDSTDWKAKFEESEGRRKRAESKLGKKKPEETSTETPTKKTNDLDYGELAFLTAKGIEADDEVDFVKTIVNNTGRSLKEVVSDDYVQAKLKAMRDTQATKNAVPSGTKRSGNSAADTVEYWLSKDYGELPDDVDLRRKVVKARIEKETKKDVFTP